MNKRIYLDNAATSFPKAPHIGAEISSYLENAVINPNRTNSALQYSFFNTENTLRERLSKLYNAPQTECIAFTRNITESLNWFIKGLLKKGDHVIITSHEHNAVMRTLTQVGIGYTMVPSDEYGYSITTNLDSLVQKNTKALIINVADNVSGIIENLEPFSECIKKHHLFFFLDTAQASPFVPIDFTSLGVTALGFTGHKGLLGPEGIGGMILSEEAAYSIEPLIAGGTGSMSDSLSVPPFLPDRLSPGTENMIGIVGLNSALEYIEKNLEILKDNERKATEYLYEGLKRIPKIHVVGAPLDKERTNIISITSSLDLSYIASSLLERANIETRVGLHCAPSSHKALHTYPKGTLRFSPGPFTTLDEIEITLSLIKEICNE